MEDFDFSLFKNHNLSAEKMKVQFRIEAFNLFNRTVFDTGSTNLDSATFGLVTSQVNNPRQMQVALKIYW